MIHLDHLSNASQFTWSLATAGVSAIAALTAQVYADALPAMGGFERLLDLGFAGVFILALLWGMRVQWNQRLADKTAAEAREDAAAKAVEAREEKLIKIIEGKEARMASLEKEVRDVLVTTVTQSAANQTEMLQLMRRREHRDLSHEPPA
jgi:endo-alpha-1,4-polygalactosaminidase (GH114 family)